MSFADAATMLSSVVDGIVWKLRLAPYTPPVTVKSDGPFTVELNTTDHQLLQAANYINTHYMNTISTSDVARAVGFSPNYLSRKFRTTAGIGLHEYIVFVRLYHAAQELLSTNDSITTIALRCGYSDSNYFKDSFKKKYGVTPRAYRKRFD